jgi:hypothetical protein
MDEPQPVKRKPFQFTLTTALVLTPVIAGLIFAHITLVPVLEPVIWLTADGFLLIAALLAYRGSEDFAQWFTLFGAIVVLAPILLLTILVVFGLALSFFLEVELRRYSDGAFLLLGVTLCWTTAVYAFSRKGKTVRDDKASDGPGSA